MTQAQLQRTEALMIVSLENLLNLAEYDREGKEIIAMKLKLQHDVNLDTDAICGEIEDLLDALKDRDREILAV